MNGEPDKPRLLVLSSTYPRWQGDPEPGFVHGLCTYLSEVFAVRVLGPHAPGARLRETMDGVSVVRYRYAPERLETLVNDGGIVGNLGRRKWKWLLLPGFLIASMFFSWRLAREELPQAVHAHWLLPQGLVAVLLSILSRRIPAPVVTCHGSDVFGLTSQPLQWLKRFVARRAAAVTVVSRPMKDALVRIGVPPENISIIPMGVDLANRFTPALAVERSREEILFVGRIIEQKGLRQLIAAMRIVRSERPSAKLTIVGFGPDEATCRALVADLGLGEHVQFVGAVAQQDLPAFYRRAALLAAPFDQNEGLGLVMVEALGCGCPVVTTRVPAVREVFGEWPENAALPGSIESLAHAILSVLEDPATARRRAAARRPSLISSFGQDHVARRFADLLVRPGVLGEGARHA